MKVQRGDQMFGFGQAKCPQCGMKLSSENHNYEWGGKNFCSEGCKKGFRLKTNKGSSGGSCH